MVWLQMRKGLSNLKNDKLENKYKMEDGLSNNGY